MKKEVIAEEHCPYCKRHCPLSNPHCKKGKQLAEEKEVKKEVKKDDRRNKKGKFYVASILLEKGELTESELKKYTKLSGKKLKKILLRMEKKNYICWRNKIDEAKISLTEHGLAFVKNHGNEKSKDRSELFSALNEAEKESLQQLLKKLYEDWNH